MGEGKKHSRVVRNFPFFLIIAIGGTVLLVSLDAFEWFYLHSRRHEAYDFDEIVASVSLFLLVGVLWYVFLMYKEAKLEVVKRKEAEDALSQLNLELERRVEQRTAQCQEELEERKRAEQELIENQRQLRALSSELALVEERERHRIATDLHDTIGHTLAIVNNQLGLLRASIPVAQDKKLVDDIREGIRESIRYSRSLIFELHSPIFNHLPFVSAIEWLVEDILEKKGIAVHLKANGAPSCFAEDTRAFFLKAIREILVNVVKHATAQRVEISVRTEADDMVVEIKDDGVGFDVSAVSRISPASRQGLGIFTVRERLTQLNGRCSIASQPGRGTSVTLTVPVQKDAAEKCQ